MPGDPKECRQHARRCDLENAQAFIAALDEIDADPPVEAAE